MKDKPVMKSMLQFLLMALLFCVAELNVLPGILSVYAAERSDSKRPTVLLILDG